MPDIRLAITTDASGAITGIRQSADALDNLDKKASKTQSTIEKLGKTMLAAFSAGAVLDFMDKALKAQGEQEAAINKLNLALANQGKFTEATSKSLQDYAGELQNTTTYSDDAAEAVMAMFASFGLGEKDIKRATKASADFAAATGKSLEEAASALAKASAGNVTALQKMGFQFDEGMTKAQKFESALQQVEQRFGGSAAAATATYTGQLAMLKNQFGEVQEATGKFLGTLAGSDKPFSVVISGLQAMAKFISGDLILALSELRVKFLQTFAALADISASALNKLAQAAESSGVRFMPGGGKSITDTRAIAAQMSAFALELDRQAKFEAEVGNQAAIGGGKILTFANAAHAGADGLEHMSKAARDAEAQLQFMLQNGFDIVKFFSRPQGKGPNVSPAGGITRSPWVDVLEQEIPEMRGGQFYGMYQMGTKNIFDGAVISAKAAKTATSDWRRELAGVLQTASQIVQILGLAGGAGAAKGGAIGSAIGGIAGSFIPGIGTVLGGAAGGILGGIFGSLFGHDKAKAQAEQRKKDQTDATNALTSLISKWEQFRTDTLNKGASAVQNLFGYMIKSTDQSAEHMQRLGLIGMAVFDSMRKSGMSMVDALNAMGPALDKAIGHSSADLTKLHGQYDALTQQIDALIKKQKEQGLSAAEAAQLEQLKGTRWAIGKDIEKGDSSQFGPLAGLAHFRDLVNQFPELVTAAESLGDALNAVRITGSLTEATFKQFTAEATTMFGELIDKGFTADQAIAIMGPTLLAISKAAQQFGLDATQMLDAITGGHGKEAADVIAGMQDPMDQLIELTKLQVEVMALLAKAFGVDLPPAIQAMIDKINAIPSDKTVNVHLNLPDVPDEWPPNPPEPPVTAAGGVFYGRQTRTIAEAGPEAVIPLTRPARAAQVMAQAGLGGVNVHGDIHLHGVQDPEQFADALNFVLRNDTGRAATNAAIAVAKR